MNLIKPSVAFLWATPFPLGIIEMAGRTCYKSEAKTTANSAPKFAKKLIAAQHEAMLEHASMSFRVICDRGVTHEIVRHRLFSYAQESTRYCSYKKRVSFIIPSWVTNCSGGVHDIVWHDDEGQAECVNRPWMNFSGFQGGTYAMHLWFWAMAKAEWAYIRMLENGATPQEARSVLPNSLKTEIVITGNMREWRHFFKLRTAKEAHPDMQVVAKMLLAKAKDVAPVLFDEFSSV